ncbi:hypothetical protein RIF29_28248 [Crotalaria pallida]|uniref:Uncharacterized protein n=1 Tax=Crotalaria pallida TaxID=3830 RepID=A0AAN9I1T3_CROPI
MSALIEKHEKHATPSLEEEDLKARSTKKAKVDDKGVVIIDDAMDQANDDSMVHELVEDQAKRDVADTTGGWCEVSGDTRRVEEMQVDSDQSIEQNPEIGGGSITSADTAAITEDNIYGPWMIVSRNNRRKFPNNQGQNRINEGKKECADFMETKIGGSRFHALGHEENGGNLTEGTNVENLKVQKEGPTITNIGGKEGNKFGGPRTQKQQYRASKNYKAKPNIPTKGPQTKPLPNRVQIQQDLHSSKQDSKKDKAQPSEEELSVLKEKKAMKMVVMDTMCRYQQQMWNDFKAGIRNDDFLGSFVPQSRSVEMEFIQNQSSRGKESVNLVEETNAVSLNIDGNKDACSGKRQDGAGSSVTRI